MRNDVDAVLAALARSAAAFRGSPRRAVPAALTRDTPAFGGRTDLLTDPRTPGGPVTSAAQDANAAGSPAASAAGNRAGSPAASAAGSRTGNAAGSAAGNAVGSPAGSAAGNAAGNGVVLPPAGVPGDEPAAPAARSRRRGAGLTQAAVVAAKALQDRLAERRRPAAPVELGNAATGRYDAEPHRRPDPGLDDEARGPAPRQTRREQPPPAPLFTMPEPAAPGGLPSTTTRRLCAAVHLDDALAEKVVEELLDTGRAVAPSYGFDLEPVLSHALRARVMQGVRDAVLTALSVTAAFVAPRGVLVVLLVGAAVAVARSPLVRAVPAAARALFVCVLVFAAGTAAGAAAVLLDGPVRPAHPTLRSSAALALLVAGAIGVHVAYHIWINTTLHSGRPPGPLRRRNARRVAEVAAAQRGNVLYTRTEPFLGAGPRLRGWSVAVSLLPGSHGGYRPRGAALTDPVLLRRHIGQALQALTGGLQPVPGLAVLARVVADGVRRPGDPLLAGGTPLTLASREALDAVIRSPQEGLRVYDQVIAVPQARPVVTADGRPVVPPGDGGGYTSVFVHTSIDASVLYVELSAHVLPSLPVSCETPPPLFAGSLTDLAAAPWRLLRRVHRRHGDGPDHSARVSVRELPGGAGPGHGKYIDVVERVVIDAVADFLERHDLDAAMFRAEVAAARGIHCSRRDP